MKYLDGQYYVEVEDHRYNIHPTKNNILGLRDPPIFLRLPDQVQKGTQIRENQKVIENNGKLEVKIFPRNEKQPIIQQSKFKAPNCPSCKINIWLEFDKSYYWKNCEYFIIKQKHQIDKKVRRQGHYF